MSLTKRQEVLDFIIKCLREKYPNDVRYLLCEIPELKEEPIMIAVKDGNEYVCFGLLSNDTLDRHIKLPDFIKMEELIEDARKQHGVGFGLAK